MAGVTTAFCTSAKAEMLSAGHCIMANATPSGQGVSAAFTLTNLSSVNGIAVGMTASGTNVASGAIVASIDSSTQVTVSKAHTGTVSAGTTLTFAGDTIKVALYKAGASLTGTYDSTTTNYSQMGSDEVANGGGYVTGGQALTPVSAVTSGTTAYVNFSPNPQWTSATFTTSGCLIYNSSSRLGGASSSGSGRAIGNFSFSGDQTVSAGTFTVLMPSPGAGTAILRLQ
jgi:hypothetical protein